MQESKNMTVEKIQAVRVDKTREKVLQVRKIESKQSTIARNNAREGKRIMRESE